MDTMQSSIVSKKSAAHDKPLPAYSIFEDQPEMYDSLSNGECFQKPKFDYRSYLRERNNKVIFAPGNVFQADDKEDSDESSEDSTGGIP